METVRQLGLESFENTNYITAMKRVAGTDSMDRKAVIDIGTNSLNSRGPVERSRS